MEKKYYTNERSVQIVISLLKAHGIRKVVASPGTTNLTLIGSLQQDPFFEIYSSVDERSAAYLACGLAAESGEGVVLSCTGATASRNYMSGLTEAFYRKLPVIAITSNQGEERIGHLVAQNIDRRALANDIAKISVSIPIIRDKSEEWNVEMLVNKALLETKRHGGGPVHINLSTTYSKDFSVKNLPSARRIQRFTAFDEFPEIPNGKIGIFVGAHKKFSIEETEAIDSFCSTYDAVVFCDHTSGYYGKYKLAHALVFSQVNYTSIANKIDLLIHIGEVSGDYTNEAIGHKVVWRVSEDGEIRDTFRKLTCVFEMPEKVFFNHYSSKDSTKDSFYKELREEYDKVYSEIPELPFCNIWAAMMMHSRMPKGCELHLGILNTLRSWNFFTFSQDQEIESYSNVGGFGIDGDMSALVGASLANSNRLYFGVLGDLAFFYDMNVVGNRHVGNNVRIMLVNNGRGTEFRNFNHPAARFGEDADKYMAAAGHYGNKSNKLVKHYAEDLGYEYLSASSKKEFNEVIDRFLCPDITDKPMLFEIFTDSQEESDALKTIYNMVSSQDGILRRAAGKVIRTTCGENGINVVKKIMGK